LPEGNPHISVSFPLAAIHRLSAGVQKWPLRPIAPIERI
jgi:hypothetical protein